MVNPFRRAVVHAIRRMNTMSPSPEVSFVGSPTNLNFVHRPYTKERSNDSRYRHATREKAGS